MQDLIFKSVGGVPGLTSGQYDFDALLANADRYLDTIRYTIPQNDYLELKSKMNQVLIN